MSEQESTQAVKPQEPEAPKPLKFNYRIQASKFFEIIRAVDSVIGYGLEKEKQHDMTLTIGKKGITAAAMDGSRVAMVQFELAKEGFEAFQCKTPGQVCFGPPELMRILKKAKRESHNSDGTIKREGDMLHLSIADERIVLELQHVDYSRTFSIGTLEPDHDPSDMPKPALNPTVSFKIMVDRFRRILDDIVTAEGDIFSITTDKEGVLFEARSGEGLLDFNTRVPKDKLLQLNVKETAKAMYNTGFLQHLLANLPKDTQLITFNYGSEMPCHIETNTYNKLDYYLAPRISATD